jgi:hypothetical protein
VRRRRLTAGAILVGFALIVWALASSGSSPRRHAGAKTASAAARSSVAVSAAKQIGELPEALQDSSVAAEPAGSAILLLGGLDGEEGSTAQILRLDPATGATSAAGSLPVALHDACAAEVGGADFVFGGGESTSFSAIVKTSPEASEQVATLPSPASDVACAVAGGTAYVVGGYTGSEPLQTIVAWQPGQAPRVAGRLPKPLRYAAVGTVGARILIAGGTSGTSASRDVYAFDPSTGSVTAVGALPAPVAHAAGVAIGGALLVIGGRGDATGTQTDTILSVSPTGRVSEAGRLPLALSDAAALPVSGAVVVAGGLRADGTLSRAIWRLSVAAR